MSEHAQSAEHAPTDHVVDARGERCPLPVIRLARLAAVLGPGATVTLLATDPAARHDVPAWCRMRGHELHSMTEVADDDGRVTTMVVVVRGRVG
ncbi:sulfurtransferase TusA family protein [Actinomycetota bacterium]